MHQGTAVSSLWLFSLVQGISHPHQHRTGEDRGEKSRPAAFPSPPPQSREPLEDFFHGEGAKRQCAPAPLFLHIYGLCCLLVPLLHLPEVIRHGNTTGQVIKMTHMHIYVWEEMGRDSQPRRKSGELLDQHFWFKSYPQLWQLRICLGQLYLSAQSISQSCCKGMYAALKS